MSTVDNPNSNNAVSKPLSSNTARTTVSNSNLLTNLLIAAIAFGCVVGIDSALSYIGSLFVAVVPYLLGGLLFATIVTAFFLFLRVQKNMRRSKSLRISFSEGYTSVVIFITMGLFAAACMHAFQRDGMALSLWTEGFATAAGATCLHGLSKFFGTLYAEGKSR